MKRAVFAGSCSPVHSGHVEIIRRISELFDEVIVAVTENVNKPCYISLEDKKNLLVDACHDFKNVKVMSFNGTLADFCKENAVDCIVKSMRNSIDFEYEYEMATVNKKLFGVETLFLLSAPEYRHISSTLVREFLMYGKDISALVPDGMASKIKEVVNVSKI